MTPTASPARRALWLTVFAVSMGLLEAAVVVYLRELYYPAGFRFPIVLLPERIAIVEILREASTILMLAAVAVLAGQDAIDRFFVFGYLFGGWDLVYYLGLRLCLGWPSSLLTWDILFLIPVPWLSPVLCPVLVSVTLIGGFVLHAWLRARGRPLRPTPLEWGASAAGAFLIVLSMCWEYRVVAEGREPGEFPWGMLAAGLAIASAPLLRAARRAIL